MVTGMTLNMTEVDARRLLFPMPVIRRQNSINTLTVDARFQANCTDPGTMVDILLRCQINNHTMISSNESDFEFVLEKVANER
ncbi:MAG: tRNA 2-thiouridine synthesizing protein A [Gammaproteobacteria bacterium]|jgi:tRNA 2-thiouridine synthesizing protein A